MPWNRTVRSALLYIIMLAALAFNCAAQVPVRKPVTGSGPVAKPPRQEPCWEVAGVPKSAIEQRRAINQQARHEIEAVCANSSLSVQQKRQEIRQIHQRERQEIEAIITPAQQEAMRACQQARNHGGHGGHGGGFGGRGPCGELEGPKAHSEKDEGASQSTGQARLKLGEI
jgi:hypothetical protein